MKLIIFLLSIIALSFATEFGIIFQKADLNFVNTIQDWDLKGILGVEELKRVAKQSQAGVIELLEVAKIKYKSYYVANHIVVEDIKPELLARISKMPGVLKIEKYDKLSIFEPKVEEPSVNKQTVEWNVEMVRAPEAWAKGYNGTGIVVANLDTGVYFEHKDLLPSYRGNENGRIDHNYNWYDGTSGKSCRQIPCDQNGHGTHTMGTMVGINPELVVGVAPGAKWIACRSFAFGGAQYTEIMSCLEWFINPTDVNGNNPNPSKRPHLINHSWGGAAPYTPINEAIATLNKLGSLNFVSAGNSGSRCSSLGWPGAFNESFTSGALAYKSPDTAVYFSSRGPVPGDTYLKPDVITPGERVNSCKPGGGYQVLSGTSMSSPCTTGAAAIILSARRDLIGNMERVKEVMFKACKPIKSSLCSSKQEHPNNVYGWGLVDIIQSL